MIRLGGRDRGTTLAEVMIAILLTAVVVTSVFGVCLAAKRSASRYEHKVAAKNFSQKLINQLENYLASAFDAGSGPNRSCAACGGTSTWTLPIPGDACGGCVHALAAGNHDVTSLLPAKYKAAPYSMTLKYLVTNTNTNPTCGGNDATGIACARYNIKVTSNWTEQQ